MSEPHTEAGKALVDLMMGPQPIDRLMGRLAADAWVAKIEAEAVRLTDENAELLRRLDAWTEDENPGPLIRWAAAHLRGEIK